jgi:hypothetical protein
MLPKKSKKDDEVTFGVQTAQNWFIGHLLLLQQQKWHL